jgi:hypothetical protein
VGGDEMAMGTSPSISCAILHCATLEKIDIIKLDVVYQKMAFEVTIPVHAHA